MYYESKANVTKITATSRCAVKIRDNYYTIEFSEERSIPDQGEVEVDIVKERKFLWDAVNTVVDDQIQEIIDTFK